MRFLPSIDPLSGYALVRHRRQARLTATGYHAQRPKIALVDKPLHSASTSPKAASQGNAERAMSSLHRGGQGPSSWVQRTFDVRRTASVQGDAATRPTAYRRDDRWALLLQRANPRHFQIFRSAQALLGRSNIQVLQWDGETECQTMTERTPSESVVFHLVLNGRCDIRQGDRRATVREGEVACHQLARHGHSPLARSVRPAQSRRPADNIDEMSGVPTTGPDEIAFDALCRPPSTPSRWRFHSSSVMADLASSQRGLAKPSLAAQAERMMALLLLDGIPNRVSHAPAPISRIAPFYVRRVERHLQDISPAASLCNS